MDLVKMEAAEVSKIRGLIQSGLSDTQIAATLLKEAGRREDFGASDPRQTLQAIVNTMHRALHQNRVVAPQEVVRLMSLFDKLWHAAINTGDAETIEDSVLVIFNGHVPGLSVRSISKLLAADMDDLIISQGESPRTSQGIEVQTRYLRKVDNEPVVCVSAIAYSLSISIIIIYDAVVKKNPSVELLNRAALRPLDPILVVGRPTWSEMIGHRSWRSLGGVEGKGFLASAEF